MTVQSVQNTTLRMAVEIGLPNAVVSKAGKSITAAELATVTNGSKDLIGKIRCKLVSQEDCYAKHYSAHYESPLGNETL